MPWPGITKDVLDYTKSCFSCKRAKHSNQQPPGLMNSLSVPDRPWSTIGFDFVVKLPESAGFNSILVIVDRFSTRVHLISANQSWNAEEFAFAFLDCFIRLHGLPDNIVSDCGKLIVSRFWKEVQHFLRITPSPLKVWKEKPSQ